MKIRSLLLTACLLALAASGCAGTAEETGATTDTTPAAAAGDPATAEPALPAPAPEVAAPAPAETAATPAAQPAAPAQPPAPTLGGFVTHKVKDYDAWKKVFDAHVDGRKAAGALGHGLMRDAANDKLVSVWVPGTDVEKLKAFLADPALKDKMKEAGVQGKPTVAVIQNIEMKMDPAKQGLSAVGYVADTKDYAAFKTAFDAAAQARTDAGIIGYGIGQDADKPTTAHVYLQSEDPAKLKAYLETKDMKKAWKDAGVKGSPKLQYLKEVEFVMYQ